MSDDPNSDPKPEKTFTQADIDRIVQDRLAKLRTEIAQRDSLLSSVQKELEELKKLVPPPQDPPSDLKGQLELLEARYKREMEGLNKKLEEVENSRQTEYRKRLETERDKLISDALQTAQCQDMKAGYRYFYPQVFYDEAGQEWMFNLAKGGTCSIEDGIAEELPNYLRPASMQSGGSGSNSGGPKRAVQQKNLEAAKAELKELAALARSSGRDNDIRNYQRHKRKVDALERELAKT